MRSEVRFYRLVTDPYQGIRSIEKYDWDSPRIGRVSGPFAHSYLADPNYFGMPELGSGFPRGAPPSWYIYKQTPKLRDVMGLGFLMVVSDRAKQVFQSIDPGAFDFHPAKAFVRGKDGVDHPQGAHWECDVIRIEDCVDRKRSNLNWILGGKPSDFFIDHSFRVIFKDQPYPDRLVFRHKWAPEVVVCTPQVKRDIETAKLTGVAFIPYTEDDGLSAPVG